MNKRLGDRLDYMLPPDTRVVVYRDIGEIVVGGSSEFFRSDNVVKVATIPLTKFHVEGIIEIFGQILAHLEEDDEKVSEPIEDGEA